jgi:LPS-assembly lipoprotein
VSVAGLYRLSGAGRPDRHGLRVRSGALALIVFLVLAGGCGFRLRGTVEVPPELNPIYLQAPSGSLVQQALVEQLAGGPVALAANAKGARLILRILGEQRSSRVAATDSTGKVLAYDLHFDVSYDAVLSGGAQKVPTQFLNLIRTFDNPDVEVLGKQLEEEQIYRELALDAADRILMRLRAALR